MNLNEWNSLKDGDSVEVRGIEHVVICVLNDNDGTRSVVVFRDSYNKKIISQRITGTNRIIPGGVVTAS